MSVLVVLVLGLDAAWFTAGFWLFSLRSRRLAAGLTRAGGAEGLSETVAGLLRFLGGLNLALAALCVVAIADRSRFSVDQGAAVALGVAATAHLSQFAVNVPIARAERAGRPVPWPVLRGLMSTIFAGDLTLGLLSLILAVVCAA